MVEAVFHLAATPNRIHGRHQTLGPFRRDLRRSAQIAPGITQTFNVGNLIVGMRLIQLLQPLAPHSGVSRCLGDDGNQGIDGPIHGGTDRTRGTIDVL